jgi:hypothetical protein
MGEPEDLTLDMGPEEDRDLRQMLLAAAGTYYPDNEDGRQSAERLRELASRPAPLHYRDEEVGELRAAALRIYNDDSRWKTAVLLAHEMGKELLAGMRVAMVPRLYGDDRSDYFPKELPRYGLHPDTHHRAVIGRAATIIVRLTDPFFEEPDGDYLT